jgi:hypothetical protein
VSQENPGIYVYFGASRSSGFADITLTQDNVRVPSGTTVKCSMEVSASRNPGFTTSFELYVDGQKCSALTVEATNKRVVENTMVVSGDVHTIVMRVASSGADQAAAIFTVDNVAVVATAGPGFVTSC